MWLDEDGGMSIIPADSANDVMPTQTPGGLLDVGREVFDLGKASLSKLLDVYAYREMAETNALYSPMPGFQRVPGSNQVIPAGKVGSIAAGGISVTTVALLLAVVYLFSKKA